MNLNFWPKMYYSGGGGGGGGSGGGGGGAVSYTHLRAHET